jgi:acetyl esterase/lipase
MRDETTFGMREQREIRYSLEAGDRGVGDLFLPDGETSGSPVLLIHGGGWKSLGKEGFEFMVPYFLRQGRAVFNINYRLLGTAPWPACGMDCIAAGHFVLEGGLAGHGLRKPESLLVCGASAGGHLAMVAGLGLPQRKVEAVLSLAGPSRIDWVATNRDPIGLHENFLREFFGEEVSLNGDEIQAASPALCVGENPPPLFCLHSVNDLLVPVRHSMEAVAAWRGRGGHAEVTTLDGLGNLHGFWIDGDRDGRLRPEVEGFVCAALETLPAI